jgi:hypothetical protein
MEHPAGESEDGCLLVSFNRHLKLEFHGSHVTSDAGILAHREMDDALGLTDPAGAVLSECRHGRNTRLPTGLFRQAVFGRLADYEDVNAMPIAWRTIRQCARWWAVAGWIIGLSRPVKWAAAILHG